MNNGGPEKMVDITRETQSVMFEVDTHRFIFDSRDRLAAERLK